MADKKVIAVTNIHRTLVPGVPADKSKGIAAKAPKIQVIQAGSIFLSSTADRDGYEQSEYDELKALGAIRDPEKDEKVSVSVDNIVADDLGGGKATKTTTTKSTTAKAPATKESVEKANTKETGATAAGDVGNDLV